MIPASGSSPAARHRWRWCGLILVLLGVIGAVALRARTEARLLRADPDRIAKDPLLAASAMPRGQAVYRRRCAGCHGIAGSGDPATGVPNLTDRDWLYGSGKAAEIEAIITYGIRAHGPRTMELADMPAFAHAIPYAREPIPPLTPGDIRDVVESLLAISAHPSDPAAAARGARIYGGRGACWDCHGRDAAGDPNIGAPNLLDAVWLYGTGAREDLYRTIADGRAGVCPAWLRKLSPIEIRSTAVYVASLSVGKPTSSRTQP